MNGRESKNNLNMNLILLKRKFKLILMKERKNMSNSTKNYYNRKKWI